MARKKTHHEVTEEERIAKGAKAERFIVLHDVVGSGAQVDRNDPSKVAPGPFYKDEIIDLQELKSSGVDIERLVRVGAIRPAREDED